MQNAAFASKPNTSLNTGTKIRADPWTVLLGAIDKYLEKSKALVTSTCGRKYSAVQKCADVPLKNLRNVFNTYRYRRTMFHSMFILIALICMISLLKYLKQGKVNLVIFRHEWIASKPFFFYSAVIVQVQRVLLSLLGWNKYWQN